jgi:AcrR family transcriptional regulator
MYRCRVPRTSSPALRLMLVERAAEMLARREPVTLRALVAGTGASTMAVYTHFDGMPGLWRAVRQEGFTRLARRLDEVETTDDPIRDLAALGAAYLTHALADPALYRVMFDAAADLDDPDEAARSFGHLVAAADRARRAHRFRDDADPAAVATRYWAAGHGLVMLVLTGVLPFEALTAHAPAMACADFVAAGDDPRRSAASVRSGWAGAELERPVGSHSRRPGDV